MNEDPEITLEVVEKESEMRLGDLAEKLAEKQGVRVDQAVKRLYKLWQEEKITFRDPDPPDRLSHYVASVYNLWFWILAVTVALTTLSIYMFPQQPPYIYLRYVLGALSVLYLPGFALIEALYPKPEDLEPLERLALSIGLSLALVPLVGLVLNYTPWGIRLNPIFGSLCLLTLTLACASVVRKFGYYNMKVEAARF